MARFFHVVITYVEGLATDDHFGILKSFKSNQSERDTVTKSFVRAAPLSQDAGLVVHPDKSLFRSEDQVVVGAEFHGRVGHIGRRRPRSHELAYLSLRAASPGKVTGLWLRRVTSTWLFVARFRRPLLSLLHAVYRELPDTEEDLMVRKLSAGSAGERR